MIGVRFLPAGDKALVVEFGDTIERAGWRHADIGKAVAAEILHGRVQAGRFHPQNRTHDAIIVNGTS